MKNKSNYTKWHNEIALFSQIKPILILEGNVLDTYQYPITNEIFNINQYTYKFIVEGVVVKEETLDYGSEIVYPENPTKENTQEK